MTTQEKRECGCTPLQRCFTHMSAIQAQFTSSNEPAERGRKGECCKETEAATVRRVAEKYLAIGRGRVMREIDHIIDTLPFSASNQNTIAAMSALRAKLEANAEAGITPNQE